jgi:hypothetical protein
MSLARKPDDIYVFVEGEHDEDYYVPAISRILSNDREIHPFWCDGKDAVIEVCSLIYNEYDYTPRVIFFVDKDLEDVLGLQFSGDERTYVTDYYSIENHVCRSEFVRCVAREFWKVQRFDLDVEEIAREFNAQHASFIKAVIPLAIVHVAAKCRGLAPNMNNVTLGKYIDVNADGVSRRRQRSLHDYLRDIGIQAAALDRSSLHVARCLVRQLEAKVYVRGKFELWFLLVFLNLKWATLAKIGGDGRRRMRKTLNLLLQNIFTIFRGRMPEPASLTSFLQRLAAAGVI